MAQFAPDIEISGRIQADTGHFDNDKFTYTPGNNLRRGYLTVGGRLTENWEYKAEYDYAPDELTLRDGFLRYRGFENTFITFGNFKQFSSLEEITSDNNTTFMERGSINAMVTSRRVGLGYQYWVDKFSVSMSTYEHDANNLIRGRGVAGRFAYRPDLGDGKLLHLAFNTAREEAEEDIIRYSSRPESFLDDHRIIDTRRLPGTTQSNKTGLEMAYVKGQFAAQAEFVQQSLSREFAPDLRFDGYYAFLSYFLTNDTRPYSNSNAAFDTVEPSSPKGAWEIAARISNLDLNDKAMAGGEVDIITLGMNYYMTSDLLFMVNYVMTDSNHNAGDDDPNILQMRVRFTF